MSRKPDAPRSQFAIRCQFRCERLREVNLRSGKEDKIATTRHEKVSRTIAIGDIHGCAQALAALIEAIQPGPQDEIVTLGDCIDGGPDSRGVIDQLLTLSGRCRLIPIMGNHEQMLLAALETHSERGFWQKFGGVETLASYDGAAGPEDIPKEHLKFVRSYRPYYETDTHIFVHANYWPNMPMAELSSTVLYWEPLDVDRVGPHFSGKTVIVGHTPQPDCRMLDLGFLKCIDTDCFRGGCLTAFEVHAGRYWQANVRGKLLD